MNNSQLVNKNSGKDDWRTPKQLFDYLNKKYSFELDPCSTDENCLCKNHFTKEDNGLIQDWGGGEKFT